MARHRDDNPPPSPGHQPPQQPQPGQQQPPPAADREEADRIIEGRATLDQMVALGLQAAAGSPERYQVMAALVQAGGTMTIAGNVVPNLLGMAAGMGDLRRMLIETDCRVVELTVKDKPCLKCGETGPAAWAPRPAATPTPTPTAAPAPADTLGLSPTCQRLLDAMSGEYRKARDLAIVAGMMHESEPTVPGKVYALLEDMVERRLVDQQTGRNGGFRRRTAQQDQQQDQSGGTPS